MKKLFTLMMLGITMSLTAQEYHVLSDQEIRDCKTPQAVAWNFVMAIVNHDYNQMEALSDVYFVDEIKGWMQEGGISSYDEIFTEERIHDISGMRPVLREGWHLVCTNEYYHDLSNYGVGEPYNSLQACSVSFDCMKDGEIYSWQSRDHDTTARVILIFKDNNWRVFNFK